MPSICFECLLSQPSQIAKSIFLSATNSKVASKVHLVLTPLSNLECGQSCDLFLINKHMQKVMRCHSHDKVTLYDKNHRLSLSWTCYNTLYTLYILYYTSISIWLKAVSPTLSPLPLPPLSSLSVPFLSLSPTGLEKAILHVFLCKNINSVNTLNEFGRRVFSSWASDETSDLANTWVIAWWDPEANNSDKPCSDFWSMETEIINMCYLRLLTLWEFVVQW